MNPAVLAKLKNNSLFAGLDHAQLESFLALLRHESFKSDEIILREGECGDRLYLIGEGKVAVVKKVVSNESIQCERLAVLGPGETFGEMELLDSQPRSATVVALEPVEVWSLGHSKLLETGGADMRVLNRILLNLARELSLRLRKTDHWLAGSLLSGHCQIPAPAKT